MYFSEVNVRINSYLGIRDQSLITSRGGGGVVLEGGTILKQAFWRGKIFTGKKHEGQSNFMTATAV